MTLTIQTKPTARSGFSSKTKPARAADQQQPIVTRMSITPTLAANWLDNANTNNRHINEAHVRRLAQDMKRDKWVLTHEGIAFDTHGTLLDGQHRLWAIIIADTPVVMHVWRNVAHEALMAIDLGSPRTIADVLRLSGGHGNVQKVEISILRSMIGGLPGPAVLTVPQAADLLDKHRDAIKFAIRALPNMRSIANASTRAVIARAYYSCDHQKLLDFGRMLCDGIIIDSSMINVVLLREFLIQNSAFTRENRIVRYAKTQRSLLALLNGETLRRLHAVTSEFFPLPEEASRS